MSSDGAQRAAEAAQDLYALAPADFTGERDRLVREARDAGDRELAATLKGLRRPVLAAWAVNLLVRRESALVQQVLEIGEALREAQEGLAGDALRDLGRQRRELVAAVVARAAALVEQEGATLGDAAQQQVAATLNAALADAEAAGAVTSGLLVKPLEPGGIPDLREHVAEGLSRSRSATTAPRSAGADDPQAEVARLSEERRRLRREAAEQRLADAEQAVDEARSSADDLRGQLEQARSRVLQVEARIDELRRTLADLETEAEAAVDRAEELEQEVEGADAAVAEADDELEAARRAVSEQG